MEATAAQNHPTVVLLGNSNPQMIVKHPETGMNIPVPAQHIRYSVTSVLLHNDYDLDTVDLALSTDNDRRLLGVAARVSKDEHREHIITIHDIDHLLDTHSAGKKPDWVSCPDDPLLEEAISEYFGIARGEPQALITLTGRDAVHNQVWSTGTQPAAFNYLGLADAASATAPSSSDSLLTGEIHTVGGGLIRAQGTFAHTSSTNTSTLTRTFTANGTDALPVTASQVGVFNYLTWTASPTGTQIMAFKTPLSGSATMSVSGDNVTDTETLTAG